MEKIILIKVDQLSISFPFQHNSEELAQEDVLTLVNNLELIKSLGSLTKCPALNGYTNAFGWNGGHVRVCFSPKYLENKIFVYFTATGLRYYLENSGENCDAVEFIERAYELGGKLTRIDIAVDAWNTNDSVEDLYQQIRNGKIMIANLKNKSIVPNGVINSLAPKTLYFGKRNSGKFLRIYDKKIEQQRSNSPFMTTALSCNDWIRMEGEFRGNVARKMGDLLFRHCESMNHDIILAKLLRGSWNIKGDWSIFNFIRSLGNENSNEFTLVSTIPSQSSISNMMAHYLSRGPTGTLYKVYELFGESGLQIFQKKTFYYVTHPNQLNGYHISHNTKNDLDRLRLDVNGRRITSFWDEALDQIMFGKNKNSHQTPGKARR